MTAALQPLLEVRGVRSAALVDASGQVLAQLGTPAPDPAIAVAARAMLQSLQTATGAGRWNDLLLDFSEGPVLLTPVADGILLALFDEVASLGRVRLGVRRVVSQLSS